MRDMETKTAVEDAEIRNMELQLQKKMFEQVSACFTKTVQASQTQPVYSTFERENFQLLLEVQFILYQLTRA